MVRLVESLSNKLGSIVNGVITGFDRIVFKGMLLPIMYSLGMQNFLSSRNVLNKDLKEYVTTQSQIIVESAENISKAGTGLGVTYIPSIHERKEELAHKRQEETGIKDGLIGVWSCVESCNTFRAVYDKAKGFPALRNEQSRCKHIYYYFDDPTYGFMSIRLQTWAPYEIQIALNGREWLRRSLSAHNCEYILNGNKFSHIADYGLAQTLLDEQIKTEFGSVLNSFLPVVFPCMEKVVGPHLSYYWTLWQSELAKDYIFDDSASVNAIMNDLLIHALVTGKGERILKYFGRPIKADGQPYPRSNPQILSRASIWYDGLRVRHWDGRNSVKFYNEHNVLRFEMTMNDPTKYKIHRHTENQDKTETKKFLPMRKGVADIAARASVSMDIVNRFDKHVLSVEDKTRLSELLANISCPIKRKGKKTRSLDVFGKDKAFIQAMSDPMFDVASITNKGLQEKLTGTLWAKNMTGKKLAQKITRHLSMLRLHGIIRKLPKQNKYTLTDQGRKIVTALDCALSASIKDLLLLAA
jgi:predicted transcriptional regulator